MFDPLFQGTYAADARDLSVDLDGDGTSTQAERTAWRRWIDLGGNAEDALGGASTDSQGLLDVSAYFLDDARKAPGPAAEPQRSSHARRLLPLDSLQTQDSTSAAAEFLRTGVAKQLIAKLSSPEKYPEFVAYCNAYLEGKSIAEVRISPVVPESTPLHNEQGSPAKERLRSYAVITLRESCCLLADRQGFADFLDHIRGYPDCEVAYPSIARFVPFGGTPTDPNDPFFLDESEPDRRRKGSWGQTLPPYPGGAPYNDLWYLDKMDVPAAWDTEAGVMDIVIAVVDTGVDYTHPDIAKRIFINVAELPEAFEDEEGEYGDGDGLVTFEDLNTDAGRQFCEDNYGITDTNDNGIIDGADLLAAMAAGTLPRDARGADGENDDDENGCTDDVIGYDFAAMGLMEETEDNDPMDEFMHGTAIAGIIAAIPNNGMGICGVNWRCRILPVKGAWMGNLGEVALAKGVDYARRIGARLINMSWGGAWTSPLLEEAIGDAYDARVALFVASGNSAMESTLTYPQRDPRGILVNASTELDKPTVFTCFSARSDIAAPGGGEWGQLPEAEDPREGVRNMLSLRSVMASGSLWYDVPSPDENDPGAYLRCAGTSVASPAALGVAALCLAKRPSLTPERLRQLLRKTADDIWDAGWDMETGYGRINARKALTYQSQTIGVARIASPTNWCNVALPEWAQVTIEGIARAPWFCAYILDYAEKADPGEEVWHVISVSYQQVGSEGPPVEFGQLGTWDTSSLQSGDYFLRLRVQSYYGSFQDRLEVKKGPPLQAGEWPLVKDDSHPAMRGSVLSPYGQNEKVIVRTDYLPTAGDRLEVINAQGAPPLWSREFTASRIVGAPSVGEIVNTTPGHEVVVATYSESTDQHLIIHLFDALGNEITTGWPKDLGQIPLGSMTWVLSICDALVYVNDIDYDGREEVFAYFPGDMKKCLLGFRGDGSQLPGWNKDTLVPDVSNNRPIPIVIAELAANSPGKEVAMLVWENSHRDLKLYIWDSAKNPLGASPFSLWSCVPPDPERPCPDDYSYLYLSLVAGDFDNDDDCELVAMAHLDDRRVFVGVYEGSTGLPFSAKWPREVEVPFGLTIGSPISYSFAALGDIDGDLSLDIVFDSDFAVHVFNIDGDPLPTLQDGIIPLVFIEGAFALGDVFGDGKPEILAGYAVGDRQPLYAFDRNGEAPPGWPLLLAGNWFYEGVLLGRMDADESHELAVETDPYFTPTRVYCFETPGVGAPPWPMPRRTGGNTAALEVVRGDADDNGFVQCEDGDFILDYLFLNGPPPIQLKSADYNHDGYVDITDAIAIYSGCGE